MFKGLLVYAHRENKVRLDAKLAQEHPDKSRSQLQRYIKSGLVKVDGLVSRITKQKVKDGAELEVSFPVVSNHTDETLPVIFQDDNVIVIDKPAGVLTHAKGTENEEFTVSKFFKRFYSGTDEESSSNRVGIVHRLDRDTSGVMIGALNSDSLRYLQKQFSQRTTKKVYAAVIEGHLDQDEAIIDLPIGRNPSKPSSFRVDSNGKSAQTSYTVLRRSKKFSLLELKPKTGRTHQLRVHLKYLKHPIVGDKVYGSISDRLYLHASSLEITLPGGKRRVFKSKLPLSFEQLLDKDS